MLPRPAAAVIVFLGVGVLVDGVLHLYRYWRWRVYGEPLP